MDKKGREYWSGRALKAKRHDQALIDGRFYAGSSGERFEKVSPLDGKTLAELPVGSTDDVDLAAPIARPSFEDGRWTDTPVAVGKIILMRLADLVAGNAEVLAILEVLDVG